MWYTWFFSLCFERQNGVMEGKHGVWIARTFTYSEHATSKWVSCLTLELFRVRLAFLCINWVSGHLMCIIQIWTTNTCSNAPKFAEKSHVCPWVNFLVPCKGWEWNSNIWVSWLGRKDWETLFFNSCKSKTRLKIIKLGMVSWHGTNMLR